MKIGQILRDRRESLSFEFFPPKTQEGERALFETIRKLCVFKPAYVSVTYGAGGSTRDRTMSVIERIHREKLCTAMPHLTCIASGRDEISSIVERYGKMGIENILALRGDPPMGVTEIPEVEDGLDHATDLIAFLKTFNSFSIGAAAYPEGHRESPDLEMDMFYTKQKVDAGAEFLITQMFFDNRYFYDFRERAHKAGIRVPLIPGIIPIRDFKKIQEFARICGATIPEQLHKLMERFADSPQDAQKAGTDYATGQCRDLLKNGVKCFHFYTLNHSDMVSQIITNLFSH